MEQSVKSTWSRPSVRSKLLSVCGYLLFTFPSVADLLVSIIGKIALKLTGRKFPRPKPPLIDGAKTYVYKIVDGIEIPLSVYLPYAPSASPAPVMLFIHGGGWEGGNRNDYSRPLFHEFLARGFIVISADYRLLPETSFVGGLLDDIRDIEVWIHNVLPQEVLKSEAGIIVDPSNIVVTGASAGAHLALMTPKLWKRLPRSILSMYGPANLNNMICMKRGLLASLPIPECSPELLKDAMLEIPPTATPEPKYISDLTKPRTVLGFSIFIKEIVPEFLLRGVVNGGLPQQGSVPREEINEISPFFLCSRIKYPPVYQVMGTLDESFDVSQVEDFDAELKRNGGTCETVILQGRNHAFDMVADIGDEIHEKIFKPAVDYLTKFVERP